MHQLMDEDERLRIIGKNLMEIITDQELRALLREKKKPLGYIGFEPSGLMHIGQMINVLKIIDMNRAGIDFIVFLADWHAKINDKFGGGLEKIQTCGEYLKHCFLGLGVDSERARFVLASEIVDRAEYWETMLQIAKVSSLSRVKRAMTIMGREEQDAEMDFSKLIYPPMQVADIFQLKVDIAYGGMDQRHAHMLARDAAEKLGWEKPIALHSWLLPGLMGGGRMDMAEAKMSKSDPKTSIVVNDSPEEIAAKISAAYCPRSEVEDNPVLALAERLIIPAKGKFSLIREEKFGGGLEFDSFEDLSASYSAGNIHPKDLKENVSREISDLLQPLREYFEKKPEPLERMKELLSIGDQ